MKKLGFFLLLVWSIHTEAQDVSTRLKFAIDSFESDVQLQQALFSLYVIDAADGTVVFDRNSRIGLAPASTQKIITSATSYELLGKEFKYRTIFLTGKDKRKGAVTVVGSGDPTFGSWRYSGTSDTALFRRLRAAFQNRGYAPDGSIFIPDTAFGNVHIPTGYIYEDMGNYYGSSQNQLNWKENQYDLTFLSGAPGTPVRILNTKPLLPEINIINHVKAGSEGSGDNAYLYFVPGKKEIIAEGTIPPNKSAFAISGAMPDPVAAFSAELRKQLASLQVKAPITSLDKKPSDTLYTHVSPPLDSIVYWFLKKSINLYGEALIRTVAYVQKGRGDTEEGVQLTKAHWKDKGILPTELNLADGSGLSPQNRVTTHAQVTILQYARKQPWYEGYYYAFPEYNGMKMKSGTIGGVKGFCGYHTAAGGRQYIFSFLVNNYNGSAASLVRKMYRVLDELKK